MRLLTTHQIDVTHRARRGFRQRRRPNQTRRAVSAQVGTLNGTHVVDRWKILDYACVAPAIARLVEVEPDFACCEIDDVNHTGSIDVSQTNSSLIKLVRLVKPRGMIHRDFRAEATVAKVGPITHFAVADTQQIR